jgi:hypothetical protein
MRYSEAPPEFKNIRLGLAVSASTCVPGIFEPLTLKRLYPNRTIRLVDGGVSDNQGVTSLLEQDCRVILVSDGSGQMVSEDVPSGNFLGVPLRSNSILQSRIRESQFHDLEKRRRSSLIRGLMYIHLKQDLDVNPIDWVGCENKFINSYEARESARSHPVTRYGIAKEIQKLLSFIRTDLDSFSEIEAFTLMTSAYKMTGFAFEHSNCIEGIAVEIEAVNWNFLKVEAGMKEKNEKYKHIYKLLSTSDSLIFKIWKQLSWLKFVAYAVSILFIASMIIFFSYLTDFTVIEKITFIQLSKSFLILAILLIIAYITEKFTKLPVRDFFLFAVFAIVMGLFGKVIAFIHLNLLDRIFLRRGSLEEFLKISVSENK